MRIKNAGFTLALIVLAVAAGSASAQRHESDHLTVETPGLISFDVPKPDFDAVSSVRARRGLKKTWRGYRGAVRSYESVRKQRSYTKRARAYRRAALGFDTALRRIQKLKSRYAMDAALVSEAKRLAPHFLQAARISYFEVATAYTSRGSYKRALDAVERTIQLNPRDRRAIRLREHIQLAQAAAGRRG